MANKVEVIIAGINESTQAFKQVQSDLRGIQGVVRETMQVLGVGFGIHEIARFGKEVIDTREEMGKLAQKAGVSVEAISALSYAARMADVSTESLAKGFKFLNTHIAGAQAGSAASRAMFKELGVSIYDVNGKLRPTEQILLDLADVFSRASDGAGKSATAVKLFGKSGLEMIPMLNMGKSALVDLTNEADRFGKVVTKEAAQQAEQFNDNLKKLEARAQGLAGAFLDGLVPAINGVAEAMNDPKFKDNELHNALKQLGEDSVKYGGGLLAALGLGVNMAYQKTLAGWHGAAASAGSAVGASPSVVLENRVSAWQHRRMMEELIRQRDRLLDPTSDFPALRTGTAAADDFSLASSHGGKSGKPITLPGDDAVKEHAARLEAAAAKIRSILADIIGINGDAAEKIRAEWSNKAEEIRKIFEKFPELQKRFGDVAALAELTGRVAALKERTKEVAAAFEDANEAYRKLVSQKEALPNLVATPANVPTLKTDLVGAELDRFFADRQAQSDMAEKLMKDALTPAQQYEVELAKLNALYAQGAIDEQAYNFALTDLKFRFSEGAQVIQQMSYGMAYGFGSFLQTLRQSGSASQAFTSFADSIISDMERIVTQMLAMWAVQKMMGFFLPSSGGINLGSPAVDPSGGTGILPGLSPSSMPHFASGGSLAAGQIAVIGERGPELFIPGSSGTVLPNSVLQGGGTPKVSVQVVNQGMPKNATASDPTWNDKMKQWHIQLHLDDAVNNGPLSRGQSGF